MAGTLKSLLLTSLSLTLPLKVYAHMEMVWPIPFNSKYDAAYYGASVDYSMTSPLLADGSNYPCKHYQTEGKDKVQAEYTPGQQYNITLGGSATHGGGSCQISLSYDNGQTFHVIQSYVGGCPLKPNWDFTIPSSAPSSSNALIAWTWFNLIGNREMYMNCARVSIQGGSNTKRTGRRGMKKRQSSIDSLPENFACNVGNGCQTIERHEVVFPNPGNNVVYGADAVAPASGPGYVVNGATPSGNAFNNATVPPTSIATATPATTATTTVGTVTGGGVFATVTSTFTTLTSLNATATTFGTFPTYSTLLTVSSSATATTSSPAAAATPTLQSGSCTPGQFSCNSASTWSQCVPSTSGSGTYIYMGSVPAGMECSNGSIVQDGATTCTPVGVLLCEGTSAYQQCVLGGRVEMGTIAPGSQCQGGVVFPSST